MNEKPKVGKEKNQEFLALVGKKPVTLADALVLIAQLYTEQGRMDESGKVTK